MKSKLNFLVSVSLKRKIKTKWFVLANILIFAIITAAVNIDSIITLFGGDFSEKTKIYVIDKTEESFPIFKNFIESPSSLSKEESSFEAEKYEGTIKKAEEKLKEKKEKGNVLVVLEKDDINTIKVSVTTKEFLNTTDYSLLNNALQNTKVALAIKKANISEEELGKIYQNIEIERIVLDKDKKSEEESMQMIMSAAFPIIILPFFMLTIFLVQMIGAEVNDEKTTRGMEIIISNVSPKTHFFAKVIAGNVFVILQGALLFIYSILGLIIRAAVGGNKITGGVFDSVTNVIKEVMKSSMGDKLIYMIPMVLLLMVLTFIAYSLLAGILASMTTNIEDFQQLQTPIMIVSLIGYYLAMMAGVFEGSIFIKVVSFIPFISAILAPSLLLLGQIGIIEMIASILLVIGTIFLLVKYGLKIYKVGILNYSSSKLWKKMFKALKTN